MWSHDQTWHQLGLLPRQTERWTATNIQHRKLFWVLHQPICGVNISAPAKRRCVCWGQLWVQSSLCRHGMAKPIQGTSQNPLVLQGSKGLYLALPHCHKRALGEQTSSPQQAFPPVWTFKLSYTIAKACRKATETRLARSNMLSRVWNSPPM